MLWLALLPLALADDPAALCQGSPSERLARVEQARAQAGPDRDRVRALLAAQATLMALDQVDAEDDATCVAYLDAVLSTDPARRDLALRAARAGGALDTQGQPVVAARALSPEETPAGPPDPSTPHGQALLRYRDLVAGISGCAIGGGALVPELDRLATATATWAVFVGPGRLAHPQRFAAWAAHHREQGTLPPADEPIRGGPVFLSSYAWQPRDLDVAKAETEAWNRHLRGALGLTDADVAEVEVEVEARHGHLVAPTGTVALLEASPAVAALPPCP